MVKQLPRILAKASTIRGRQIIVSTHSEKVLNDRGVDPSEIVMLDTNGQETEAKLASTMMVLLNSWASLLPQ